MGSTKRRQKRFVPSSWPIKPKREGPKTKKLASAVRSASPPKRSSLKKSPPRRTKSPPSVSIADLSIDWIHPIFILDVSYLLRQIVGGPSFINSSFINSKASSTKLDNLIDYNESQ